MNFKNRKALERNLKLRKWKYEFEKSNMKSVTIVWFLNLEIRRINFGSKRFN